ncbi:hypothetical protein HYW17_01160 [Candidatus Uhrbacteria bacterium]|nr:hypothetical protein [Candidatus Uhrbacteria bacterium]
MDTFDRRENTEALQERFPEVYKKFFAENDVVVSSSVHFTHTSAQSYRIGGLDIFQKLPFRGYVGVKKDGGVGRLRMGDIEVYFSDKKYFSSEGHDLHFRDKGFEFLQEYLVKALGRKDFSSVSFNLLLEQPENIGFDTSIATLIMAGVQLYYSLLLPENLRAMTLLKSKAVLDRNGDIVQKYLRLHADTLKLITQFVRPTASGGTIYANIMDSEDPLVYFTEDRRGSDLDQVEGFFPAEVFERVGLFDDFRWFGFRLGDVVRLSNQFPLDVVSIFPGVGKGEILEMYESVHRTIGEHFEELQTFMGSVFSVGTTDWSLGRQPPFYKDISEAKSYWYKFATGQMFSALFIFKRLLELYKHKSSSSAFQNFIDALQAQNTINEPFEETPSSNMLYIVRRIYQKAEEVGVPVGVRLLSTGKQDASILVFSQIPKFREEIKELVDELIHHHDKRIHINFASWRDGWGKDGLRVEQFISKGIYSKFIEQGAMRLVHWTRKGEVNASVVKNGALKSAGRDLLIDLVHEKIQVAGKECTSKELPSQKATVKIMDALLTAEGHRLHNRALPESGYTKYRNEFQGKITGPLVALVKKRLKKDLDLKVEGTLTDFTVSLDPKGFDIAVVKKLG